MANIRGHGLCLPVFWHKTIMSLGAPGSYWGVNRISAWIIKKCLRLSFHLLLPSMICLWTWLWNELWNELARIRYCIAWHSSSTEPTHLPPESDSIKVVRFQHILKNVKWVCGELGRGLSHFGHPLEMWVKKRWREPLKKCRLLDFHRLSCQACPTAWTSSAVSWCLPLQPSLVSAQQHGLTCHCVPVLAAGPGYWWFLGRKLRGWHSLQCQRYIHCKTTAREGD